MRRLLLVFVVAAWPALAVEPHEMLADPALEARAQALDHELRCVKCRSETIASSNADWAADARVLVRELISEGRSDAEVLDFFVERYGDYVLMTPPAEGANLVLWYAPAGLLLIGALVAGLYLRGRSVPAGPADDLSPDEKSRLEALLRE